MSIGPKRPTISPATTWPTSGAHGEPYQGGPSPEEVEEMWRARAEMAGVAVVDIVANHAVGLWQLAVLHLMPDPDPEGMPTEPRLDEARLAIDALGALVEGLGARLAPHDEALREALSQLRLAFVQVADVRPGDGVSGGEDTPAS